MPQIYELNLRDYWNIAIRRKWIIVGSFSLVFFSIFIYTNLQKPLYKASVILRIEPTLLPSTIVFPSRNVVFPTGQKLDSYEKQITGRTVLEKTARELGWITDNMSLGKQNEVITDIREELNVNKLDRGSMLRLTVVSGNPNRAAILANKVATVFKKLNVEEKNQLAHNVRVFIENTLKEVEVKLKEQEKRSRALTTRGVVGSGKSVIDQIHKLERDRMGLLKKFTKLHPDVMKLDYEINELKDELKKLPKEEFEYGILQRDIHTNESLYSTLKQKLYEARIREAEKIDNVLLISPAIAPRWPYYPKKGKNYSVALALGLVIGTSMALIIEHLDTSIGRVDDVESFIKAAVLGVIPYCSDKPVSSRGAEEKWMRIFRGKKSTIKQESRLFIFDKKKYQALFMEAFRILSVNLQVVFGKSEKIKNKVLMITSCNPEEGKSMIVSHLGIVLSQLGYRVLIIDTDTRRASIHKIFGLQKKEHGFTDILMGRITPDAAVRTATDLMLGALSVDKIVDKPWLDSLNIITSGSVASNVITLFNSDKMAETLNYFKSRYDVVLVDSSPILAVSEPSVLLPRTDGVLLVYRAGSTSRLALRRAKTQIESVKGRGGLSGVILNNVTPEIGLDTYYYYSRKYYTNEDESSKKERGNGYV